MKNILVLHWLEWGSNKNWLPWLKNEIQYKADEIFIPNLPSTNSPAFEEQFEYLNVYSNDFQDGGNLIWHSLWCQLTLKFILENNIKNSNVILVSPTYPWFVSELWTGILWENYKNLENYSNILLDFKKFNKLWNKVTIFLSDNDPYINMENARRYYSKIKDVNFIDFKNKWHFNEWAWILELEEILDYLD
jgi:predicted alpha/beta hydrolase family esterase